MWLVALTGILRIEGDSSLRRIEEGEVPKYNLNSLVRI